MAAATVTGRQQNIVMGSALRIGADSIAFAGNGDTWDTGLNLIYEINLQATTNTAAGFTVSGGILTLVSGGALTFRGGVLGSF